MIYYHILRTLKNMKEHPELQYLNLLDDILKNGAIKHDFNTGIEITSVFD